MTFCATWPPQIAEITEDTTAWLYGYMLLAYSPLSDDELATYVAFAQTEAGQSLNAVVCLTGLAKLMRIGPMRWDGHDGLDHDPFQTWTI